MSADDQDLPPHIQKLVADDDVNSKRERDERAERIDKEKAILKEEEEYLMSHINEHNTPGLWVVAVGPTTLLSMVNMSILTQCAASESARAFALNMMRGDSGYSGLTTDEERHAWFDKMARGADAYNRGIDSGAFMHGAVSGFNGLVDVFYSDDPKAAGKNYETTSKIGRCVTHYSNVKGYVSLATNFSDGNTDSLLVQARRMSQNLYSVNEKAASLFPALNVYKCVAVDCRKSFAPAKSGVKKAKLEEVKAEDVAAVAQAAATEDELPDPIVDEDFPNIRIVERTSPK